MNQLGINIGSSSVKIVLTENDRIVLSKVEPHEGNFVSTLTKILSENPLPQDLKALATGTEGRNLLQIRSVIEPICIEETLRHLPYKIDALVSMGGESLTVYTIDSNRKIITSFSGNKCASGTGEFFKQQLARMNMTLADIRRIPPDSRVLKLSSRCSVFMKSDCTHRLNKGEATTGDIVLSLSDVMALKVAEFLKKARIEQGRVLLAGGVTQNPYLLEFIREKMPRVEFIVPEWAPYLEAYGAALLAQNEGGPLPPIEALFKESLVLFKKFKSLKTAQSKVTYLPSQKTKVKAGREYILGVDGGSTTTKACLIDMETSEITASFYGRTHGDPVGALKKCISEIKKQIHQDIGDGKISITLASTTGSSREILGVFLETPAVYNEIIAHAVGTTFYRDNIDTIFEIGGQDAKYVYLKNKVPIDYAMNEACSAGTGSFLEESAQGDLNIPDASLIGDIALSANAPLKFGEHCSAFINSDIRSAIQQGASREDITAGVVTSIVSNYLNRVVGNRTIGNHIVLQGGVAKNSAVPLAFAMLLNKEILVPPDPELMGCFGVGILAKQKFHEGFLAKSSYDLDAIVATEIIYEKEFQCKSCDNFCPIRILNVNGHKYMFGGRCNKYANIRKKNVFDESEVFNYIDRRNEILFNRCAPDPATLNIQKDLVIGIPRCFSVYTLWPLYSWFFHLLGVRTFLSDDLPPEGTARVESNYCFPAEIAHGAVQDVVNKGADYVFLPHFRDMESYESDAPANFCPITQSLPYYIKKAFPEIPADKYLAPVVSFRHGPDKAAKPFMEVALKLGFGESEAKKAFLKAYKKQMECFRLFAELGKEALAEARRAKRPVIAILGRPYNSFTADANMGIPKKYTSRGYCVIPFDILPFAEKPIYPNMYWYYGQQDMKAARLIREEENIYVTFISNFSCAPDSFMLHYLKWMMGIKPFLILELDSHTADAGVDTRIEAFLDIIEGYRLKLTEIQEERYDNGLRFINKTGEDIYIQNAFTCEKIPIRNNPRVKILLSSMGRLGVELLSASLRGLGINAVAMPVPDVYTLQMARNHASGKECLPSHLVLGSVLKYLSSEEYRKDEIYLLFVPTTTGPCRTGQYFVFYENLFKDLHLENVVVFTLDSDNSYNELGPEFSKYAWWAIMISDYMKDIETALRTCAADPQRALEIYNKLWHKMIKQAEKDITKLLPRLDEIAREIAKIPLKKTLDSCPKILIIGEIYVRRDDFAVDQLIELFSKNGIMAKVSNVTEWVYYCDFTRRLELNKRLKLMPWYRQPFSHEFSEMIQWKIEHAYKKGVEKKIRKTLSISGLLPKVPHNMDEIMANTEKHFVSHELYSEISISSGVAATAMMDGYAGIVNISPFACLIGRVIEGVLTPWARERKYPVISIEIDGNLLPPGIVNKLEIFMLNVLRFQQGKN
ncbi:MAG TPA: acyl-CoA dehydratase activase [Smithella sp.]|nr:acyl-CoA dehydratase activase [Smithella sp.]